MSPAIRDETQSLERFRSYLHVVAKLRLQGEQQKRVDAAAMVRQTLQDAERQPERLHGSTPAETATWLRRLLAQNLGNAFRVLHQQSRECLQAVKAPLPPTPSPKRRGGEADSVSPPRIGEGLGEGLLEGRLT